MPASQIVSAPRTVNGCTRYVVSTGYEVLTPVTTPSVMLLRVDAAIIGGASFTDERQFTPPTVPIQILPSASRASEYTELLNRPSATRSTVRVRSGANADGASRRG